MIRVTKELLKDGSVAPTVDTKKDTTTKTVTTQNTTPTTPTSEPYSKKKKVWFSILFWFLNLTWGAILTIPGLLITGFLILIGKPAYKNGCSYYVVVGGNWGGAEIGAVSIIGDYRKSSYLAHIRKHEFGHSVQQMLLGPFQIFLVFIPSAIRYWYDRLDTKHAAERGVDWYDSIWFEGTATKWGTIWVDRLEGDKVNTLRPLCEGRDKKQNISKQLINLSQQIASLEPETYDISPENHDQDTDKITK